MAMAALKINQVISINRGYRVTNAMRGDGRI